MNRIDTITTETIADAMIAVLFPKSVSKVMVAALAP